MKFDLRFTARPLDTLWCQMAIALVFQESMARERGVSDLDVKTSGYLTYLWESGFWTGVARETLLVASQNKIKADKILLKGLGARADYSAENLSERIREICSTLEKMSVNDIAIHVPVAYGLEFEYPSQLEMACINIIDYFMLRYRDEPDLFFKAVVSVDSSYIGKLEPTVHVLKGRLKPKVDATVIIDNV